MTSFPPVVSMIQVTMTEAAGQEVLSFARFSSCPLREPSKRGLFQGTWAHTPRMRLPQPTARARVLVQKEIVVLHAIQPASLAFFSTLISFVRQRMPRLRCDWTPLALLVLGLVNRLLQTWSWVP